MRRELLEERKSLFVHGQDSIGSSRKTDFNFSLLKPSKSLLEGAHERYERKVHHDATLMFFGDLS